MNDPYRNEKGFTVIELIVAMGVFVVIVTVAVGTFITVVRNERKLTSLMEVNNNAGGVLEQMAREIRTGYRFCDTTGQNPDAPCALFAQSLAFTNYQGKAVTYEYDGVRHVVTRSEDGGDPRPMTAGDVTVTRLDFTVVQYDEDGSPDNDVCVPWRIGIIMGVRRPDDTAGDQEIKLETTVSSRVLPKEAPNAPAVIESACVL